MFKKNVKTVLAITLILIIALSICSCGDVASAVRDIPRITDYTSKVMEFSKISDPEEMKAKAEELIHPKSGFTVESILEKAKNDDALQGVDLEQAASEGYSIGQFSDPKLKFNDPSLGGNVYEITISVTLGDQAYKLIIDLLSDEIDIGLFDFDITK